MLNVLKNENMLSARPQLSTQARQGFWNLKKPVLFVVDVKMYCCRFLRLFA